MFGDPQATVLQQIGLDPDRLHYLFQGLRQRLIGPTDEGRIIQRSAPLARLLRPSWKILKQVPDHQHSKVHICPFAITQAMVPVGINHVIKRLAQFDQTVHQSFHNLDVRIGLP